jgi:hypothetical protein
VTNLGNLHAAHDIAAGTNGEGDAFRFPPRGESPKIRTPRGRH